MLAIGQFPAEYTTLFSCQAPGKILRLSSAMQTCMLQSIDRGSQSPYAAYSLDIALVLQDKQN